MKLTDISQQKKPLDWDVIRSKLHGRAGVIRHHEIHNDVSSTNDLALQQCANENTVPAVYFAERQTAGRGRRGKEWHSPWAQNIYMSLSWHMSIEKIALGGLSMAMGVVVARCLRQYGIIAELKWPNDVMVGRRKMAGILVESRMRAGGMANVVIGVGMNFEMMHDRQTEALIQQAWTDFLTEYRDGVRVTRNELAGSLLDYLICGCQEYECLGLGAFLSEWQSLDICRGREIDILVDGVLRSGVMLGIEQDGALRVRHGDEEKIYHSAEISVRLKS